MNPALLSMHRRNAVHSWSLDYRISMSRAVTVNSKGRFVIINIDSSNFLLLQSKQQQTSASAIFQILTRDTVHTKASKLKAFEVIQDTAV